MKIRPIFAWYDFWIGLFWDAKKRRLYVFPVPMLGFFIDFVEKRLTPQESATPVPKEKGL